MRASGQSNRGQIHPLAAFALGMLAVAGLVAAVLVSRPPAAAPGSSTPPPSSSPVAPSGDPTPSADPTPTAVPTPSLTPEPTPEPTPDTADPTIEPSAEPSDGIARIALDNLSQHDVIAQVQDVNGILASVRSGRPGDGMSVRWHDYEVENRSAEAIALTWVGLPQDEVVDVHVDAVGDGNVHITIVQTGPVANSDALGEDRILHLTFDRPQSADKVTVEILDRTID